MSAASTDTGDVAVTLEQSRERLVGATLRRSPSDAAICRRTASRSSVRLSTAA